jgi:hypothetical protein
MKKNLFILLAVFSAFTVTSCSTSSDDNPKDVQYSLSGKVFSQTVSLPITNDYNTDIKELENFKKCLKWSNFLKDKYTETETTKESSVNFVTSSSENYKMSFTDKEHCSLVTLHTFKYNVKLCSVYTYKCKLPKTFYSVNSGIYKEVLNANEFIYNNNTFKLNDYTYTKEVFTEKNSIGQKEKIEEINKTDFRYTIDSSGNLTFIDNNSKEKYIGTIKDNKLYIDIKTSLGEKLSLTL